MRAGHRRQAANVNVPSSHFRTHLKIWNVLLPIITTCKSFRFQVQASRCSESRLPVTPLRFFWSALKYSWRSFGRSSSTTGCWTFRISSGSGMPLKHQDKTQPQEDTWKENINLEKLSKSPTKQQKKLESWTLLKKYSIPLLTPVCNKSSYKRKTPFF